MIYGPPTETNASSNELADWLELEVLTSENDSAALQSINQTLEIAEDEEPAELDDENLVAERRLQQVVSAVKERKKEMGIAYPFQLDHAGTTLQLSASISPGGYTYLFCLIVSAGSPDGLLDGDGPAKPDLRRARELFQICATVAAAGFTAGPAASVGWPRPDSSGFLDKLKTTYDSFGDGEVHQKLPAGAPAKVKDDEIDVIAWQYTTTRPALGYFLGQAASGRNWEEKSLRGHAAVYHGTWFVHPPAATPRLGTLMPFYLPSEADADPDDHRTQEEIVGQLRRWVLAHEHVLHRHYVARFIEEGLKIEADGKGPVERAHDLAKISDFVTSYREQLRAAARAIS